MERLISSACTSESTKSISHYKFMIVILVVPIVNLDSKQSKIAVQELI